MGSETEAGGAVTILEICVDTLDGVRVAIAGGADRIELCSALSVGGLTPSAGLATMACALGRAAGVPIFAMVRPRPGDFAYDEDECALAIAEGCALLDAGVDGLVFGTCAGGNVDEDTARMWLAAVRDHAARAVPVTFHRAIDLADDPIAAAGVVAALGYDRILTSGGARRAVDGIATIAAMVARVGARTTIMAGSGVTAATAIRLLSEGSVRELHASASRPTGVLDQRIAAFGFAQEGLRRTDRAIVREIRKTMDSGLGMA